jgi:hypothetical protein
MLSTSGNPELRSLSAILAAAGLKLSVKPIGKRPTAFAPLAWPVMAGRKRRLRKQMQERRQANQGIRSR